MDRARVCALADAIRVWRAVDLPHGPIVFSPEGTEPHLRLAEELQDEPVVLVGPLIAELLRLLGES